jgi:hypothetical protein
VLTIAAVLLAAPAYGQEFKVENKLPAKAGGFVVVVPPKACDCPDRGPACKSDNCPKGGGKGPCSCEARLAAPVSPDVLNVPQVMAPPDARRWQVNGRGNYSSAEVRAMGLAVPGDVCVGGNCGVPANPFTLPSLGGCPNGQCGVPATSYRRFR